MEQIVKLIGRIAEVMPAQEGVSARTGNAWKSQEYLFEYFSWSGAQYPNRIVCRVFGEDNIAKFNLKQGEEVTAWLRFDANKSQDGTRWFNEVRITRLPFPTTGDLLELSQESSLPLSHLLHWQDSSLVQHLEAQ